MIRMIVATIQHAEFITSCFSSREIQGDCQRVRITDPQKLSAELLGNGQTGKNLFVLENDGSLVGYAYSNLSPAFDQHEVGVTLIPEARGKGLGTEGHLLVIKYSVFKLQARRLVAYVSTNNLTECALLHKLGFQLEGVMKKAGRIDSVIHDIAVYAAFADSLSCLDN